MVFALDNLPYWLLLGAGFLLFGFVIFIGGGDEDVDVGGDVDADIDADFDVDADVHTDVDIDLDADANLNGSGLASNPAYQFLGWLGIGKAPLILLLGLDFSLWGLLGWVINSAVGTVIGRLPTGMVGGIVFFGSMVLALWLGSLASRPIGKIFASFGEDISGDRLIGCMGKVSSAQLHKVSERKIAQVDVLDAAKNLVTINAVIPDWATHIPKFGDAVLVIERSDQTYLYMVVLKDSADQAQWFNANARSGASGPSPSA
jgi:hypothetical protein